MSNLSPRLSIQHSFITLLYSWIYLYFYCIYLLFIAFVKLLNVLPHFITCSLFLRSLNWHFSDTYPTWGPHTFNKHFILYLYTYQRKNWTLLLVYIQRSKPSIHIGIIFSIHILGWNRTCHRKYCRTRLYIIYNYYRNDEDAMSYASLCILYALNGTKLR